MDLSSLLSETLTARGYEVEDAPPLEGASGATYPVSLIARRDGDEHLVDVLATRGVTERDVEALASIVDDTGVDGALLFAIGGVDDVDPENTPSRSVELWERQALEGAIGDLFLDRALGGNLDLEDFEATTVSAAESAASSVVEPLGEPAADREAEADPAPLPGPEPGAENGDAELVGDEPAPAAASNGSRSPEPQSAPQPESEPAPEPDPEPEPAAAADPEPAPEPQQEPGAGEGQFVSPEEMARRAKEMLEKGEIPDDGDAELITEDDAEPRQAADPQSERTRAPAGTQTDSPGGTGTETGVQTDDPSEAPAGSPTGSEPELDPNHDPETADPARASADEGEPVDEDPGLQEGQVFEDADCELLPSKPRSEREATAQQDEPATPEQAEPEPSTAPDPEPDAGPETPAGDREPATPPPTGSSPAAAAGPPSEDDEAFLSGGVMDPEIDGEAAKREAKEALFQVHEARLELLPFHVFEYSCVLEGGGNRREEQGRLWVSAQSGGVVAEPEGNLVEDPGTPHERFQARLGPSRATHSARDHLLDDLEVRDELREDFSETAVIERVTLSPREDSLQLDHLGKAFAPRWRVEGQNGTVFVDAITGDLVTG